ncbi:MAG TPA: M48 family metalloprotease [Stellaceae bacterium]|nr:M48 family metalloprotease [Stellaceae bacterium]
MRTILKSVLMAAVGLVLVHPALAQQPPSFIRDAEIESTIRTFATPIFRAAGLDPEAVHIYLINDSQLNAFVAGGQNLFLNTGTILRSERPNQLVGVMAHETGHIAGGHLARTDEALRNASIESIIGLIAGVAAAVATGNGAAGSAAILGSSGVAQRSFLQFSVAQEASADQAGMTFLDRTQQSSRGLLEFFQILEGQEFLSAAQQSPYLRTHPLTSQRVETVNAHVVQSRYSNVPDPPEWVMMHARMKAKLAAFLGPPGQSLGVYKEDDHSAPSRYARAIAYYRIPDLKRALPLIDGLITEFPTSPYYPEMKGQMLFENGHVSEALAPYEQAVKLAPKVPLLRMELAQVQLETNDQTLVPKALVNLKEAVRFEDRNPEAWRLLAIAYGRSGDTGMTALALAEQGMAEGDTKMAQQESTRAVKLLPPGPARLHAQDLLEDARHQNNRK